MRVLLAGASGVIGRQIAPLLAREFDLKLSAKEEGEVAGLPVLAADITDFGQALRLVDGVDAVINSAIESPLRPDGSLINAGSPDPAALMQYNESGIEVNVRGAYHLYEAAARSGVKKFVFISSMTAVVGKPHYDFIAPDAPVRPRDFYACTKIFGETLGQVYAAEGHMKVLCLRLGQPYPAFHPDDGRWPHDARVRGLMVAVEDVARAVTCALQDERTSFGVFPILSESDAAWVDDSAARAMGYTPGFRFLEGGAIQRLD